MDQETKRELLQLVENSPLTKNQKTQMKEYIETGVYPKNKTKQVSFYRAYRKIRLITRLGVEMKKNNLMKE